MTLKKLIYTCIVALPMASPLLVNAMGELEPNEPVAAPQTVAVDTEIQVTAAMGDLNNIYMYTPHQDLDFYTFYGNKDDVVTIDIDNGVSGIGYTNTILHLFGPGPDYKLLDLNDVAADIDAGSTSKDDARLDNVVLPATGMYTIGVSDGGRFLVDGGGLDATNPTTVSSSNGDYNLVVTLVKAAPEPPPAPQDEATESTSISIEILAGKRRGYINPYSRGTMRVAILSEQGFDPKLVDRDSLTFGQTGDEQSLKKCKKWGHKDVNKDGKTDLICKFVIADAGFTEASLTATLKGTFEDGTAFVGKAPLKFIPRAVEHKEDREKARMQRKQERMQRKQERKEARMQRKNNRDDDDD